MSGCCWAAWPDRYPDCYTFACGGLVGATPELLIRRQGLQISSLVLAGTAPRGDDPARDVARCTALLASAKDTEEHGYAAAGVRESLAPLCDELTGYPAPGATAPGQCAASRDHDQRAAGGRGRRHEPIRARPG